MGAIGNANVEITFDPNAYELGDGQNFQTHGMGKITIELAETDSTHLATISAAKTTAAVAVITDLAGNTYTTPSLLWNYKTKRGFGDDVHTVTIEAQKKCEDEDDFITIT